MLWKHDIHTYFFLFVYYNMLKFSIHETNEKKCYIAKVLDVWVVELDSKVVLQHRPSHKRTKSKFQ